MKNKFVSCALLVCAALAVQAQQKFTIQGKFSELKSSQKVALKYITGGKSIRDTTTIINGAFSFSGKVQYPVTASLYLISLRAEKQEDIYRKALEDMEARQDLFVEQGAITVSGKKNMKDALIQGGKTQGEYLQLKKQLKPLQDQQDEISRKRLQLMGQKLAAAEKKFGSELTTDQRNDALAAVLKEMPAVLSGDELREKIDKVEYDYIRQHPDSYVSLDLMKKYASGSMNPVTFEPLFNRLSQRLRDTERARRWADKLANTKRVSIGEPFVDFTLQNTEGLPVTFASLKGKYLLLDFWASWCGPCRAENPNLLKAYNKFKNKNFDIVAVSLDVKKDAWLKAIQEDGMPWVHLNDSKAFAGVAKQYGITAIPSNFLLDPSGRIIARDLRGEGVEKKLAEILGN